LANLSAILAEAGAGPEQVLRMTVYIVGVENWPTFDQVYAEAFGDAKPAPPSSRYLNCTTAIWSKSTPLPCAIRMPDAA
jgi:enamine deaminase RidA (YjgF/YER057c/UK114 family)